MPTLLDVLRTLAVVSIVLAALVFVVRWQKTVNHDRHRVIAEEFFRLADAYEANLTYIVSRLDQIENAVKTAEYDAESLMLLNKVNHVLYSLQSETYRLMNFRGMPRRLEHEVSTSVYKINNQLESVIKGWRTEHADLHEAIADFNSAMVEIRAYPAKRAP